MAKLFFRVFICFFLFAALVACDKSAAPGFRNTDVTGSNFARDFLLVDQNGRTRSLTDFRGKVVVIFFGFTHCPDICPTTMAGLATVMQKLGKDADKVQVLFITVDPDRDTPKLMANYLSSFDSRFLGLTGDSQALKKVRSEFKVISEKREGEESGTYAMDHSSGTYVFDTHGKLRLYVGNGQSAEAIIQDIRVLLASN